MEAYLKPVPKPCTKKIYDQMENYLYRINEKEGNYEIGYFIRLKDKNEKSYIALVTSPNVLKDIDSNSLKITIDQEPKSIELGDIRYEDKKYGRAVIEIKDNNDIKYFFESDENIFKSQNYMKKIYNRESIYIIQYDNKDNISVSYGIISDILDKKIKFKVNINSNIKYNIILNLNNNKIIGMLDDKSKIYNNGIFINDLIDQFIYKINNISTPYSEYEENINSISLTINVDVKEVNKQIYFLDNYYNDDNEGVNYNHDHLKELNEDNTELYINGSKRKYEKYFIPEKEGEYKIELKFEVNLKDCSYMFSGCENIKYINLSNFNTSNANNMSYMFNNCASLNSLTGISKWNTTNVKDMNSMFKECYSLNSLPDISKWDTSNVDDMSYMFWGCASLNSLPDISKWNTSNVKDMNWMFYWCESLKFLPDISNWNTSNVNEMLGMFFNCKSLNSLPDISKWNTSNVNNMSGIFGGCNSLNSLPDISKWKTTNVKDMNGMFKDCYSLNSLPDISKWNTSNVNDISFMFDGCISLNSLPDISKWNKINADNMRHMFDECISSLNIH